jgi:hypothetical protein
VLTGLLIMPPHDVRCDACELPAIVSLNEHVSPTSLILLRKAHFCFAHLLSGVPEAKWPVLFQWLSSVARLDMSTEIVDEWL